MEFSVSATNRSPRVNETHGVDYYFLSTVDFSQRIENKEFLESEEVYTGCFYGTLRSEVERISARQKNIVFDVDVMGGLNIKKEFGDRALAIFVAPPSIEILHQRLKTRGTDTQEMIQKRIGKANYEMTFASKFDVVIVNDVLEIAKTEAENVISNFLKE